MPKMYAMAQLINILPAAANIPPGVIGHGFITCLMVLGHELSVLVSQHVLAAKDGVLPVWDSIPFGWTKMSYHITR